MSQECYSVVPDTTIINVEANAGEPFELTVPILDDNDEPVSIPPGTEGDWLVRAQVRRNHYAATVLHEWTTAGGGPNAVIVPGAESVVLLTATAEETTAWQDWPDYSCAWDLWLTEPAGGGDPPEPSRLAKGSFRLWPSTTQ